MCILIDHSKLFIKEHKSALGVILFNINLFFIVLSLAKLKAKIINISSQPYLQKYQSTKPEIWLDGRLIYRP